MKKWILIMLSVVLMLQIYGCGKKQKEKEEDTTGMVYEGNTLATDGLEGEPELYCVKNGTLYLLSAKWTENEALSGEEQDAEDEEVPKEMEAEFHFYRTQIDGGSLEEISLELSEHENIKAFYVEDDGSIVYMLSGEDGIELRKRDGAGQELLRENITKSVGISEDSLVSRVVADGEGNIFVASSQKIYILNESFQPAGEVELKEEQYLHDMTRTKDGQIVYARTENRGTGEMAAEVCLLDTEKRNAGDVLKGISECFSKGSCLMDGAEYDFYYKSRSGIYGYNITDKTGTKLLDAESSYLTSEDVRGMVFAGDNRFVGVMYDDPNEKEAFSVELYTWIEPSAVEAKQTITYGSYGVSDSLIKAAREFNKENKDYKIEFKIYEAGEEGEYTEMLMDIIAGNVPDIIRIDDLPISAQQCVSKGLLADLTPYYEKDAEVNMDAFIPSVLEGMKIDGKLYYIAPYCVINTVAGRASDVGTGSGWTFDELMAVLEKKGSDVIPFYEEEKSGMLEDFLMTGLSDFVDWQTGKCSFDSEEFKDILLLCNRGVDEVEYVDSNQYMEYLDDMSFMFTDGKILLEAAQSVGLTDVQNIRERFGEEVTFIGYPNREREGSYFMFWDQTGIYSQSKVKDKAWEFIRLLGEKEYQYEYFRKFSQNFSIPTRQDCLDMRIQAAMAEESYIDEFGNEVEPLEKGTFTWGGNEVKYGPVSQEDVDTYLDLINRTRKSITLDEDMMLIVLEEASDYFAGDKDLDKTVQIIQKRIETYVNESR